MYKVLKHTCFAFELFAMNATPARRVTPSWHIYMANCHPGWQGYPTWQTGQPAWAGHPTCHENVIGGDWITDRKRKVLKKWEKKIVYKIIIILIWEKKNLKLNKKCCSTRPNWKFFLPQTPWNLGIPIWAIQVRRYFVQIAISDWFCP